MITQTTTVEGHLAELGIKLPAPPTPLGAYVESSDTGNLLFLSGMLPVADGKLAVSGRLGADLTIKQGQEAARAASLNSHGLEKQGLHRASILAPASARDRRCP